VPVASLDQSRDRPVEACRANSSPLTDATTPAADPPGVTGA